ncbi:hypothetical protein TD95_003326 [Thielaviopsis punctulata]|uniref:ATP-dependent RNA helicase n=1 Tax=Thielaviopsis punctulata TaxID=72032 RepID=A0A0F4ZAQ3_9PEZI|nr:hypothetical protein TD95_003326 [Thielaviopsis punctulata]
MYARWVPPSAGSGGSSSRTGNNDKAYSTTSNNNNNDDNQNKAEENKATPILAATNGFGYARWTPAAPSAAAERKAKQHEIRIKKGQSESESESSEESSESSEESSDSESESESESEKEELKRKRSDDIHHDAKKARTKAASPESESESTSDSSSDSSSSSDSDSDSDSNSGSKETLAPQSIPDAMEIDSQPASTKIPKKEKRKPAPQNDSSSSSDSDDDDDKSAPSKHKTVLQRKAKSLQLAQALPDPDSDSDSDTSSEPSERHGLEPLPQPDISADAAASTDPADAAFETLPAWLAAPIRVSPSTHLPFTALAIPAAAAAHLRARGFPDAFAVQTAAIPLLTPSARQHPGDVLVAAPTGSGKTLAYALPIVRDLSAGVVTRLRALVVLPTRELVRQAAETFDVCAAAFDGAASGGKRVRVGVAVGNQSLRYEQSVLLERSARVAPGPAADDDDDDGNDDDDVQAKRRAERAAEYAWRVDVLLCTPGRLVDHLRHTPGFSLAHVRWLVVDEADKLLAQSFQGWLGAAMGRLARDAGVFSARDHPGASASGVRKVVLSATLTRDLSLLAGLELVRPRLVVLQSEEGVGVQHVLPEKLGEKVVRIKDAGMKPLYLVEVLKMISSAASASTSAPSPESSSESSSESSDSDSESDPSKPTPKKHLFPSTVLIFTKSNESALRLTRLLTLLLPSLARHISTLTSSTPSSQRRTILRAFSTHAVRILIASDLVARGIDVPRLDHVVNYDLPASLAAYVHRVGRTARAGRCGTAWTLLPDVESGWFWGRVAKAKDVGRATKVQRVRIGNEDGELPEADVARYEEALAELGRMARGQQ